MAEEEKRGVGNTCILVFSLLLIVCAFALCVAGIINPSWQVVDIREFRAEHHHGLWQDCTRAERHIASTNPSRHTENNNPMHCTYKFDYSAKEAIDANIEDVDQNSAALESEHHQFFGWQKVVLGLMVASLVFAALALTSGLCAPCNGGCAVIYSILIGISFLLALCGDGVFFFAAHRVDHRFVQGLVGTYEQRIGDAFYFHFAGTVAFLFAFITSIIACYSILRTSDQDRSLPLRELAPLYGSRMRHAFA